MLLRGKTLPRRSGKRLVGETTVIRPPSYKVDHDLLAGPSAKLEQ